MLLALSLVLVCFIDTRLSEHLDKQANYSISGGGGANLEHQTASSSSSSSSIDVKIGFLVGRQRLKPDRAYSRPGRQLMHVFNYGIDKINQIYSTTMGVVTSSGLHDDDETTTLLAPTNANQAHHHQPPPRRLLQTIKFKPIVAETFGNESESIKQTIDLILRHHVNVIVGPQETCQLEPRLASIFNVPMISHFCPQWTHTGSLATTTTTFIQTKPPHWKIVMRVVVLVGKLLESFDSYPQQLVLLYFKESASGSSSLNNGRIPMDNRRSFIDEKPTGGTSPNQFLWQQDSSQSAATIDQLTTSAYGNSDLGAGASNEAIQYKLIGELLEVKLKELLARHSTGTSRANNNQQARQQHHHHHQQQNISVTKEQTRRQSQSAPSDHQSHSLTVLNWHTTFHYGYTKNPFRGIIRRHLFQQTWASSSAANQSAAQQCKPIKNVSTNRTTTTLRGSGGGRAPNKGARSAAAAIYIVVGHNYEHLGLMLSLDELGLLNGGDTDQQRMPATALASNATAGGAAINNNNRLQAAGHDGRPTVVVGVDIEPYDERDDSVRFLRGLLMDSSEAGSGAGSQFQTRAGAGFSSASDLNSVAAKYNHYIGVVPTKPLRMAELLDEMRHFYNNTLWQGINQQLGPPASDQQTGQDVGQQQEIMNTNSTIHDSVQLTTRLFQFIRLPVEAFYLHDSIMLIGSYFSDCLTKQNFTLETCSSGKRMLNWFANRKYSSYIDQNASMFDSFARAEGSYTIITRRHLQTNDQSTNELSGDDEFGLAPIGRFVQLNSNTLNQEQLDIELSIESNDVDQIWLPFWCYNQQLTNPKASNMSECEHFTSSSSDSGRKYNEDSPTDLDDEPNERDIRSQFGLVFGCLVASVGFMVVAVCYVTTRARGQSNLRLNFLACGPAPANDCWFSDEDEQNFLQIVQSLLLVPETFANNTDADTDNDNDDNNNANNDDEDANSLLERTGKESAGQNEPTTRAEAHEDRREEARSCRVQEWLSSTSSVDLHCYMFPFPSCKFVHWLTALHQLKEMLFQYQSNWSVSNKANESLRGQTVINSWRLCSGTYLAMKSMNRLNSVQSAGGRHQMTSSLDEIHLGSGNNNNNNDDGGGNNNTLTTVLSTNNMTFANRSFFTNRHKGTPTLRLLLNKYKSINERLCHLSQLNHSAIVKLYGVTLGYDLCGGNKLARIILEQPDRGNLRQALDELKRNIALDAGYNQEFKPLLLNTLVTDIVNGLEYLHSSKVGFHGELRATTCLLTPDWRLKLAGFHVNHMRRSLGYYELKYIETTCMDELVYFAPEVLVNHNKCNSLSVTDLRLADFYSFSFILYELIVDQEPWTCCLGDGGKKNSKLLIERVKVDSSLRPPLLLLDEVISLTFQVSLGSTSAPAVATTKTTTRTTTRRRRKSAYTRLRLDILKYLLKSCWSHSPQERPQSVKILRNQLKSALIISLSQSSIYHRGAQIAKTYTKLLERNLCKRKQELDEQCRKVMNLKMTLLPDNIIATMSSQQCSSYSNEFKCVSLCAFRFIILPSNNNNIDSVAHPKPNLFHQLTEILNELDDLIISYHKHIHLMDSQADSMLRYLIYSGEPLAATGQRQQLATKSRHHQTNDVYNSTQHIRVVASFALELIDLTNRFNGQIQIKCSLHCGPVLVGLFKGFANDAGDNHCGALKLARYILMGSAMQIVDLLEQTSQPQRIQISAEYRNQLMQNLSNTNEASGFGNLAIVSSDDHFDNNFNYHQQDYIIIKRGNKISAKNFLASDLETYWLLNGPRLTTSQRLMLS